MITVIVLLAFLLIIFASKPSVIYWVYQIVLIILVYFELTSKKAKTIKLVRFVNLYSSFIIFANILVQILQEPLFDNSWIR